MKTTFWTEPDFQRWSCYAKLLYIYLLTTPRGHGITGTLQASPYDIQHDTGMTPRQQRLGLHEIGYRVRHYTDSWLWVVARFRYACLGPKHVAAARNRMKYIPEALADDFRAVYAENGEIVKPPPPKRTAGYPINGVSIRYPRGTDTVLDSENENESENERKKSIHVAPSLPEAGISEPPLPPVYTFRATLFANNPSGNPYHVTAAFDAAMTQAFPGINTRLSYDRMTAWLLANPTRRKTPRGMARFIRSWLEREQNAPPKPAGARGRDDRGSEMGDWT